MKRNFKLAMQGGLVSLFLVCVSFGCVGPQAAVTKGSTPTVKESATKVKVASPATTTNTTAASAKEGGIYDINVKPLTTADCARCHIAQFMRIKKYGAKHRSVACTDCHEIYHAYNPLKKNYAKIMPKCSSCHDEPHGKNKAVQNCLACHKDPHAPIVSLPDPSDMESECRICHSKVAREMKKYPSAHSEQDCSSCHSQKHGRKPDCSECHESHSPMVAMNTQDCLACHPVHTPLQITYSADVKNNAICAGCHEKPFDQLKAHKTKHSKLACAKCHPKHKQILSCQTCHGKPHNAVILKKFPKCGDCHNTAHNLRM